MKSNNCLVVMLVNFVTIIIGDQTKQHVSVTISDGQINGKTKTVDDREVNVFLGIPYAQPPIGSLRFKKPLPAKAWSESLNADHWPNPCYQIPVLDTHLNKNFSEDCLYLNIWTPSITSDRELKAVMFWIHGGGFRWGSSSEFMHNGEVLSTKGDVVVVTFNYRLNTFGFLYTGSDDAPGNVGIWDQVLALEWVKDNIKYFGGDPQQITLFGESAGSFSVSLHLLSPVSRNLYQNAIMMSGTILTAISSAKDSMRDWLRAAQTIGCNEDDSEIFTKQIIDCVMNADAATLVQMPNIKTSLEEFIDLPVIDGQLLPKKPIEMLESGYYKKNANLLFGTTGDEGSFILAFLVDPVKYHHSSPQNMSYNEATEELVNIWSRVASKQLINGEDVAKMYLTRISPQTIDYDLLRRTIGIAIGDYFVTCPSLQFAKVLFDNDRYGSKVYQYYYNNKMGEERLYCAKWMGACHANDIFPVFGVPFINYNQSLHEEREESSKVIEFFTHFAKYGMPAPQNGKEWPKYYTINDNIIAPYFEIDSELNALNSKFNNGLKTLECEYLWKNYF